MARRNLSLNEEEIAAHLQAGRISPQAERLATSHNPARQVRGAAMMADQLRAANVADQQAAGVERQRKAQEVETNRVTREQESQVKAQAAETERQRMIGVRQPHGTERADEVSTLPINVPYSERFHYISFL